MASRLRVALGGSRALMAAAKASASSSSAAAKIKTTGTSDSNLGKGLQKVLQVSPQLGNFLGATESSRNQAVKKVWDHITLHNLQNPQNKKEIFCDEKLKSIFDGKDKVAFQEITKYLSNHFVKSG